MHAETRQPAATHLDAAAVGLAPNVCAIEGCAPAASTVEAGASTGAEVSVVTECAIVRWPDHTCTSRVVAHADGAVAVE